MISYWLLLAFWLQTIQVNVWKCLILCYYCRKDNYQVRVLFTTEGRSTAFYWLSAFSSYNLQNCCNSILWEAAANFFVYSKCNLSSSKKKRKQSACMLFFFFNSNRYVSSSCNVVSKRRQFKMGLLEYKFPVLSFPSKFCFWSVYGF